MPGHEERGMRTQLSALLAALVASSAAATAAAADLLEPATGTRFESQPSVDGTDYECLGAGVLAAGGYAVSFCIDSDQAEAVDKLVELVYPDREGASLERQLVRDQDFFDALSEVPGDKMVVLRLVAPTSRSGLAEAFRGALDGKISRRQLDQLSKALPSHLPTGQVALIYTQGSRLVFDFGGAASSVDDEDIAQKLWQTWLGPRSVSPSLKSSIAHRVASEGSASSASLVRP